MRLVCSAPRVPLFGRIPHPHATLKKALALFLPLTYFDAEKPGTSYFCITGVAGYKCRSLKGKGHEPVHFDEPRPKVVKNSRSFPNRYSGGDSTFSIGG